MDSKNSNWCTPRKVVDLLLEMGPIALDPCSSRESIIPATRHVMLPEDGLAEGFDWAKAVPGKGSIFVNPPYGRTIGRWTGRTKETAERLVGRGRDVYLLVPARVDTEWWHGDVVPAFDAILFYGERLGFHLTAVQADLPKGKLRPGATFPSALVYFGDRTKAFRRVFAGEGWIVRR
jgi:hypothetical protein